MQRDEDRLVTILQDAVGLSLPRPDNVFRSNRTSYDELERPGMGHADNEVQYSSVDAALAFASRGGLEIAPLYNDGSNSVA